MKRVRYERHRNGLTLVELAAQCGMEAARLNALERGMCPDDRERAKLSEVLGVPEVWLMREIDPYTGKPLGPIL